MIPPLTSLRARLAIWYGALLAVVLAAALGAAYFEHGSAHLRDIDADSAAAYESAAARVRAAYESSSTVPSLQFADPEDPDRGVALVGSADGHVITTAGEITEGLARKAAAAGYGVRTMNAGDHRERVLVEGVDGVPDLTLVITRSLALLDASLERLRGLLLLLGAGGVAVALLGGWAIAGSALRPVAILTATARSIAASRTFSRRVPQLRRTDELGDLARTFNDMLASLEAAHRLQQRFVSDTSHELRTPLTTIHGNAQLLAQDDTDPAERREAASQILRETTRLARLIDELLALARADAGPEPLGGKRVELDEVLMEAFEELRPQAGGRLRVVALDEAPVLGDRDGLKQVALILLDNALRYTPSDGRVDASVAVDDGSAVLRVEDSGIGLDEDAAARAFERFYRSDAARRMAPEGTGLGLPIARWIVERHGGSVELAPRDACGTRATVRIPLAMASAGPRSRG